MSTDGENAKNQSSEIDDSKPNLDSTDSSQESSQDAVKSENEDLNKSDDAPATVPSKVEKDEPEKNEKPEKKEPELNNKDSKDKDKEPKDKEKVKDETDNKEKKIEDTKKDDKKDNKVKDEKKKEQDKTDDDTEEGDQSEEPDEEEDEEDEDDDKKDVPLLDQPLEQSGPRERKKVQRFDKEYTADQKEKTEKTDIPSGAGTQLGDIARIDASISRFKTEDLKLLHRVLFKIPGKAIQIKKNIRKFNGFDFDKESDEYPKKVTSLQKMEIKQLKSICEMLDLDKSGKKDEIAERVCEFLLEPKDSGKPSGGGRPKRTAAVRANNRGYSSHEDDASDSDTPKSRATRGKGRRVNLKEESSSDEEFNPSDSEDDEGKPRVKRTGRGRPSLNKKKTDTDDEISDVEETPSSDLDSDEPKAKKKRGPVAKVPNNKSKKTPAKSPGRPGRKPAANSTPAKKTPAKRGRKKKQESSDEEQDSEENNAASSSEDEPLIKKNKQPQPPSDEEIKTYVKEILEGANLEEITMKTVCKQVYAHYPDFDLAHKKDFIKTTVKSLIST